jgi:ribulose-phosphate 3-epimerase
MAHLIAPSVLAADFTQLRRDIEMVNSSKASWFHVDVMDGVFVPNISFGMPVIKAIKTVATKPLDVHLMIVQPERYIKDFKDCGADILTVHAEACTHLHRIVQEIKLAGMKAGVALNPHTPVSALENVIHDMDMVLIMSVNPGFGGQHFIENTFRKLEQLKKLKTSSGANFLVEVDGGVTNVNAAKLVASGVDVLVAGNYVFAHPNPHLAIESLM